MFHEEESGSVGFAILRDVPSLFSRLFCFRLLQIYSMFEEVPNGPRFEAKGVCEQHPLR